MNGPEFLGPKPEPVETGETKKQYIYEQVAELPEPQAKGKVRYTPEELFEQNKFQLPKAQLDVLYGVYSFDEQARVQKWIRQGSPAEGTESLIADLRREIFENEDTYNQTVDDGDAIANYTYSDLLTDATTYRGERVKQVLIQELIASNNIEGIVAPIEESIEMLAMMGDEIDADQASALMFGEYGIPLESELVPAKLQAIILDTILKAYEEAVKAMEAEEE